MFLLGIPLKVFFKATEVIVELVGFCLNEPIPVTPLNLTGLNTPPETLFSMVPIETGDLTFLDGTEGEGGPLVVDSLTELTSKLFCRL